MNTNTNYVKLPAKRKFIRFEKTPERYDLSITTQVNNRTPFREHYTGGRKKLIVYEKLISTTAKKQNLNLGKLPNKRFTAFLGRFNKQLYKRFRTIPELYSIDIKFTGGSKGRNDELWAKIPVGGYFYNVDVKKAYWQIGHKLGYTDYSIYLDFIDNDLFKPALRYCFSFLARQNYMVYRKGKKETKIECDTSVLKKVYENVRKQLYCEIATVKDGLGTVIEWNIDGVSVLKADLPVVMERFASQKLLFKIVECRKIDEFTYSYGYDGRVKNFKVKRGSV
jgi:hypothetical protein